MLAATHDALSDLAPQRVFIAGRQQPGSGAPNDACSAAPPTQKNASALKRGYLRRSRKGDDGQQTWTG
jgi:hypothetical protein